MQDDVEDKTHTLLFGVFNTVLDVDVLEVLEGLSIELLLMD